jgi:hypothetical protein
MFIDERQHEKRRFMTIFDKYKKINMIYISNEQAKWIEGEE